MKIALKSSIIGLIIISVLVCANSSQAIDIPQMKWTPRSDWIDVTKDPYNAKGNGVDDDTKAIQNALNAAMVATNCGTVYLPTGVYKISDTLQWGGAGLTLVGDGKGTTIQWAGAAGGTMFWSNGTTRTRYIGIAWQGSPDGTSTNANRAGIGIYHHSVIGSTYPSGAKSTGAYESRIRHENESFSNFSISGIEGYGSNLDTANNNEPTAETMIWNCLFRNCTASDHSAVGVRVGSVEYNCYQWTITGCEFVGCDTGVSAICGKSIIFDDHFEGSVVQDISIAAGISQRIRRCTSVGSNRFLLINWGSGIAPQIIEDCYVDSWVNKSGAFYCANFGPTQITNCVFTNPPSAAAPILMVNNLGMGRLTVAGNYCPTITNLVSVPVNYIVQSLPCGSYGSNLPSANIHFLNDETISDPDSECVLDITKSPYYADNTGAADSTAAIQQAIAKARNNNNGTIVYIPYGRYKITSTLDVTGSNYTIQGSGMRSKLQWFGAYGSVIMNVVSPQNIQLQQFNLMMSGGQSETTSSVAIAADTTSTALRVTSSTSCSLGIDGVYNMAYPCVNYGAQIVLLDVSGVNLSLLPAGSLINIGHLDAPLTINDCGAATVFCRYYLGGSMTVNGATKPKTGFLGFVAYQGGQTINDADHWDVTVDDNQNLVIGDWYEEQCYNHLRVGRGAATGTASGYVVIGGVKQQCMDSSNVELSVNNYLGQVFYSGQAFMCSTMAQKILQTGTSSVDIIMADNVWTYCPPVFNLSGNARLIEFQNLAVSSTNSTTCLDAMPTGCETAIAKALDRFHQLGAQDLALHYGIENILLNSGAELDVLNPSPTTTSGYGPENWSVAGRGAYGSGIRNVTTVTGSSPFGPGTQSILVIDNTASTSGSRLGLTQANACPLAANVSAVLTFDFKLNADGTNNDLWVRPWANNVAGCAVHLRSTGTTCQLSAATSSGSDVTLTNLAFGTWYRVRVALSAPSTTPKTATLYLTPWSGTGPGTTTSYVINGLGASEPTGYDKIYFNTVWPGESVNINLDNITLVSGDPLAP